MVNNEAKIMKKIIIALMLALMIPVALAVDSYRVTFDSPYENGDNCRWMGTISNYPEYIGNQDFPSLEEYQKSCGLHFNQNNNRDCCLLMGDQDNNQSGCQVSPKCTEGGCFGMACADPVSNGYNCAILNITSLGYESIDILSSTRFSFDCQTWSNATSGNWGMFIMGKKDNVGQFYIPFAGTYRGWQTEDFPLWEMGADSCIYSTEEYTYNYSRDQMETAFSNKSASWDDIDQIQICRYLDDSGGGYNGYAFIDNFEITGFDPNSANNYNEYPYFTTLNLTKYNGDYYPVVLNVLDSIYEDYIQIGVNEYLFMEAHLLDTEGDTIEWGLDYDSARNSKPDCFDANTICGYESGDNIGISFPATGTTYFRFFANDDHPGRDEQESYNNYYRVVQVIPGTCGIPILNLSINGDSSQFEGYPQYVVRGEQNVSIEYNLSSSVHVTGTVGTCPTIALWRKRDAGSWILLQNNSDGGYFLDTSVIPDGTYQFRIQGYNGSYITPIDTSDEIEMDDEFVGYTNLLTPCESESETFYTHNQTSINFTWEETAGLNVVYDLYVSPYSNLDYRLIAGNLTDLNYTWSSFTTFPTTDIMRIQLISRRNTSTTGTQDDSGYVCSILDDGSNIPVNITSISNSPTIRTSAGISTVTTYWSDTEGENVSYAIDCLGENSPSITFTSYSTDNPIEVDCGYSYSGDFRGIIFLTDQTHGESYLTHEYFYVNVTGAISRTSELQFLVRDKTTYLGISGVTVTIDEIGYSNTTGTSGYLTIGGLLPQAYFVEFNDPDYYEEEAYYTSSEFGYTVELIPTTQDRTVVNLVVRDSLTNLAVESVLITVENPITYEYAVAFTDSNGEARLYDLGGASFVNYELTKIDYADSTGSFAIISFTEQNYTLYIDQYTTTIPNVTQIRPGGTCQDSMQGIWLCGIKHQTCNSNSDCISDQCGASGQCSSFNYSYCDANGKPRNQRCVISATFNGFMSGMTDWMLNNFLWMLVLIIMILALASLIVMVRSRSRS